MFAIALTLGVLSACAGIAAPAAAKSETPQQSLAATGKAMAKLQSVRFDVKGTLTVTLPQQVVDQLKAKAGSQANLLSSNLAVDFSIAGAARRPDALDATIEAKLGGLTVQTEVIAAGGKLYFKDPTSGKWEVLNEPSKTASSQAKPRLSYQAVLDSAKSLTEVNDQPSTLDGVSVDHYRIVPNLVKLFAQVTPTGASANPQRMAAIESLLQNVNLTSDVWTGTSDHLIHRLTYTASVTADLQQLAAAFAGTSTKQPGLRLPAGSSATLSAHAVINLHDFNAPVKIQAPTVAP